MITLNMENGKEVVMSWIAIAVEFVKTLLNVVQKTSAVVYNKLEEEIKSFASILFLSIVVVAAVKILAVLPMLALMAFGLAPAGLMLFMSTSITLISAQATVGIWLTTLAIECAVFSYNVFKSVYSSLFKGNAQ